MRVSVVIPILNEETVLPELLRRLRMVLDRVPGGPHEIVIVDDGSTDQTQTCSAGNRNRTIASSVLCCRETSAIRPR